jgi:hypothetical protein
MFALALLPCCGGNAVNRASQGPSTPCWGGEEERQQVVEHETAPPEHNLSPPRAGITHCELPPARTQEYYCWYIPRPRGRSNSMAGTSHFSQVPPTGLLAVAHDEEDSANNDEEHSHSN